MECVQRALSGGFGVETEAASVDELWGFGCDDSFVEELLDLSNGFSETEQEEKPLASNEAKPEETQKSWCNLQHKQTIEPENGFVPLPETELSVPAEEGLESLEWLSHFVEESFSDYSFPVKSLATTREEESFFTTPVQTKTRTKRARCGTRVWPVMSPSLIHHSSSSSTLSEKKVKKNEGSVSGRRCCHCGVTKTPQWRAGPLGSKTLCNACGVRYKSGRLVPEYRPACSPTFSSELHSNNHRKVLEMRRKKEVEVEMEVAAPPRPVQS